MLLVALFDVDDTDEDEEEDEVDCGVGVIEDVGNA